MSVPSNASLDELVEYTGSPRFDAVQAINAAVRSSGSVEEQYSASLELKAQLDTYGQDVAGALSEALKDVHRTEKTLPHQIEKLKSDLRTFNTAQARTTKALPDIIAASAKSPALARLAELRLVRERIEQVQQLLEASRSQPTSTEQAQQFAVMFAGTPDEAKWKKGSADSDYYKIINKIIK